MCRIQALSLFCNNDSNRYSMGWPEKKSYYQYQCCSYVIIYYQNQIIASNSSVKQLKSLWCLLKNFKRTLAILHWFVPCEIKRLTNELMKSNKELWLLQALAIFKHSAPIEMQNILEDILLDFSGILMMLKKGLFIKEANVELFFYLDV